MAENKMIEVIGSIVVFNPKMAVLSETIGTFIKSAPNSMIYIWDNSPIDSISNELYQLFPGKIQYFKSPGNLGYGRGHNEIFKTVAVPFKYFCILNPDLEVPKESIPELIRYLEQHPEKGLATGIIKGEDGRVHEVHKSLPNFSDYIKSVAGRFLKVPPKPSTLVESHLSSGPFELPILSGCFMFFKKDHYQELNGFDDRFFLYFEDYDLSLRSYLKGKSIIIPSVDIIHKWARESHRNWKLFRIHLESGLKFYSKWGFTSKLAKKVNKQ